MSIDFTLFHFLINNDIPNEVNIIEMSRYQHLIGSSGSALVSLKQGLKFGFYGWKKLTLEKLYPLWTDPTQTRLIKVQYVFRYSIQKDRNASH